MNITEANFDVLNGLLLKIDGLEFDVGDKLPMLNAGYALLMPANQAGRFWLSRHTSGLPAGPGWNDLPGPGFTDDPVVVAMALRLWHWNIDQPLAPILEIPTPEAARSELATRGVPSLDGVPLIMEEGRFVPQP